MTRKEAKELLPIIQAFAEGKEIQIKINESKWETVENCTFTSLPTFYRIKAEPKYRPFRTKEECWDEMLKHQPFGWVKNGFAQYVNLSSIGDGKKFVDWFKFYTFADGTPFGIKEE